MSDSRKAQAEMQANPEPHESEGRAPDEAAQEPYYRYRQQTGIDPSERQALEMLGHADTSQSFDFNQMGIDDDPHTYTHEQLVRAFQASLLMPNIAYRSNRANQEPPVDMSYATHDSRGPARVDPTEMQYDSGPRESAKQALDEAAHQAHYYQPRQLALQDLHQRRALESFNPARQTPKTPQNFDFNQTALDEQPTTYADAQPGRSFHASPLTANVDYRSSRRYEQPPADMNFPLNECPEVSQLDPTAQDFSPFNDAVSPMQSAWSDVDLRRDDLQREPRLQEMWADPEFRGQTESQQHVEEDDNEGASHRIAGQRRKIQNKAANVAFRRKMQQAQADKFTVPTEPVPTYSVHHAPPAQTSSPGSRTDVIEGQLQDSEFHWSYFSPTYQRRKIHDREASAKFGQRVEQAKMRDSTLLTESSTTIVQGEGAADVVIHPTIDVAMTAPSLRLSPAQAFKLSRDRILFCIQEARQESHRHTRAPLTENHSVSQNPAPLSLNKIQPIRDVNSMVARFSPEESRSVDRSNFVAPPYQYLPLTSPTMIRVICLLQGDHGMVECTLETVELENAPPYEAISYVWGNRTVTSSINCGGGSLVITRNLEEALYRVRQKDTDRLVWADAICINQADVEERGQQVQLMRRIYKRAFNVLVWLGPDVGQHAQPALSRCQEVFSNGLPHHGIDSVWQDVSELFRRPWFWRLWVVQEIVLAQSATLMWGKYEIPWEQVGAAAAQLRTLGYEILNRVPMPGIYNAYLMHGMTNRKEHAPPVTFLRLLTLTRQFACSDPRDHIYALLGLETTETNLDEGDFYLQPDYTKTKEQVFQALAEKALEGTGSLKVLSTVQHGPEIQENLPTWVPQWDRVFTVTLSPYDPRAETFDASAGRDIDWVYPTSSPLSSLHLRGICFSTVSATSKVLPNSISGQYISPSTNTVSLLWKYFCEDHPKSSTADFFKTFAWTITAGKDWYGMLAEDEKEHFTDFAAFWIAYGPLMTEDQITAFAQCAASLRGYGDLSKVDVETVFDRVIKQGDTTRFVEAISNACGGRRFFLLDDGSIGLGPPCTKKGDIVCVLFGGIVPFLLRSCGSYYNLVGEAYVHGIMHGEVVKQMDELPTTFGIDDFEIR